MSFFLVVTCYTLQTCLSDLELCRLSQSSVAAYVYMSAWNVVGKRSLLWDEKRRVTFNFVFNLVNFRASVEYKFCNGKADLS